MDPETLLQHHDWMRALARRLVVDANVADDLAQEAWIAALKSPPPRTSVRGWLGGIVGNLARKHGRGELRRRQRQESVALPEEGLSDGELHGRVEVERTLLDAVLELDEPFRRVVLLRYFEDLGPVAIAAREGVPLNTIKSRLRRGLAQLRASLDRRHGGDQRSWLLALGPLVTPRNTPVATAAGVAGAGVFAVSMKKLALLAIPILFVTALVLRGERLSPPERSPALEPADATLVGATRPDERALVGVSAGPEPQDQAARRSSASAAITLPTHVELQLVDADSGAPLPDLDVTLLLRELSYRDEQSSVLGGASSGAPPAADGVALELVARSDARGVVRVPASGLRRRVEVRATGRAGQAQLGPYVRRVRVPCRSRGLLGLRVVDANGRPAPGMRVTAIALLPGNDFSTAHLLNAVAADAGGSIVIDETAYFTRLPDDTQVHFLLTPVGPLQSGQTTLGELRAGDTVLTLEPLAQVVVELVAGGAPLRSEANVELTATTVVRRALQDGRAVFPFVTPEQTLKVRVNNTSGWRFDEQTIDGPREVGETLVLTLEASGHARGVRLAFAGPDGHPLARGHVEVRVEDDSGGGYFREERVTCDGQGRVLFELAEQGGLPVGRNVELRASWSSAGVDYGATKIFMTPRAGEVLDLGSLSLRAEPALFVAAGVVLDAHRKPVPGVEISVRGGGARSVSTGVAGTFSLHGDFQGLAGELECDHPVLGRVSPVPFTRGRHDLELVYPPRGQLVGHVLVSDATLTTALTVRAQPAAAVDHTTETEARVREDGTFWIPRLQVGSGTIEVWGPGRARPLAQRAVTIVDTEPTLIEVDLRRAARLTVEVQGPDGQALVEGYAVHHLPRGAREYHALLDGRVTLVTGAATCDLEVFAPGYAPVRASAARDGDVMQLVEGITVSVQLPAGVRGVPAPHGLGVALAPLDAVDIHQLPELGSAAPGTRLSASLRFPYAALQQDTVATLVVPAEGRYRVLWVVDLHGPSVTGQAFVHWRPTGGVDALGLPFPEVAPPGAFQEVEVRAGGELVLAPESGDVAAFLALLDR